MCSVVGGGGERDICILTVCLDCCCPFVANSIFESSLCTWLSS